MSHRTNSFQRILGMAVLAVAFLSATGNSWAASKLNAVTTTADLAALTQEVGGDRVSIQAIAKGYQDPHFVDAKPTFLLMLQKADLVVSVGLQLELGWLPPLVSLCGNARVQPGASGYLDASQFAEILELPSGPVSRAQGDVHPLGNPHYWLDPETGRRVARGIANKLAQLRPEDAQYFEQRYQSFSQRLTEAEKCWDEQMKPYRGRKIVTYHRSWPNFTRRFGFQVMGEIEPRPGIPPSPRHTIELMEMMKREGVKVILLEPYFDLKTPNSIASGTGAKVVVLLPSVGGEPAASDYFKLFDYDLGLLSQAFQGQ